MRPLICNCDGITYVETGIAGVKTRLAHATFRLDIRDSLQLARHRKGCVLLVGVFIVSEEQRKVATALSN